MVGNNTLQAFQANTGIFPWLSLEKTNEIKEKSKLMSNSSYDQMLIQDDMYKQELKKQNHDKFLEARQQAKMALENYSQTLKNQQERNYNASMKRMGALADMYRQYGWEHGKDRDSMEDAELISRFNTKNPQVKKYADAFLTWGDDSEYKLSQELWISWSYAATKAKADLGKNFWSQAWSKMKISSRMPLDAWEKGTYRLSKNWENFNTKIDDYLADRVPDWWRDQVLWDRTLEEFHQQKAEQRERNKQMVLDYNNLVNKETERAKRKEWNQAVSDYYDSKGFTELLKEWDISWFFYKWLWDTAQNWDMPLIIGATVTNPLMWTALMATDSYAREDQEAFENMINNGATYEQAEAGAAVVWLVNATVEVALDRLLWWVETSASNAIRKSLTKNIQEEATKKWLWRIAVEFIWTQIKASWEEWLEEVIQQIVQNAAVKTVNDNQDLFEWVGQAFEWWAYNFMNILAWWSNVYQNVSTNKSINSDVATDNKTNTESQGILDRVTDYGAELITNTVSAQDKLYKAQEPRMNTLTSKKNLERRRANSDRANQLIVENGYVPTNTTERVEAHQATLNKLWSQVKSLINEWKWVDVDQTPIINALDNYIKEKEALNIAALDGDIAELKKELEKFQKSQEEWGTDLPVLENKKQVYNDIANWKEHEASKVYNDWIQLITSEIWKIEDSLISQIPWEFSNLKKDVGALIDAYDDVFKADMKNQRSKWAWLVEAYSRIEWIGDILEWLTWIVKWEWGKVIKWAGKVLLWKSLAKAKDVDFLVEQGFKGLAEELKSKKSENGRVMNNEVDTSNSVKEMTSEEEYQETVNRIMTPKEVETIVNMAWAANNLRDFYDGQYKTALEWLKWEWSDMVEMYAENTFATQKMIESHPELLDSGTTFSEVLDAYLNWTLTWKSKEVSRLDLSQAEEYTPTKFYEPQQMRNAQEVWDEANKRVTNANRQEVYQARWEFVIDAHNPQFVKELWLTDAEVNKKLMSWAAYPAKAKELSNKINDWVAASYRWAWLENSSIVKSIAVSDADLEKMVKSVEGNSQEYERKYISNTMLALDTHIDRSPLTFNFVRGWALNHTDSYNRHHEVLGNYNEQTNTINIATAWQNTVAHEMGHYLDYLRWRQLFGKNVTLSEWWGRNLDTLTPDQQKFVKNFDSFMLWLKTAADTRNEYTITPTEVFARFVARFTEWTRKTATNDRYSYETEWYNDKFVDSDYMEFAKILQEKSKLDLANEYANYEEYQGRNEQRRGNSNNGTMNLEKRLDNGIKNNYNSREGLAKEIVDNWGITLEMADNNNVGGKPYVAVSPYPNRSEIIKLEDFDDAKVRNYIEKNADKLLQKGYALGWWVNEWNVYLDVSIVLPKSMQNEALNIANKYNQKAIFDLETFEDIPAEWNWEYMEVNEDEVSDYIKSLFNKNK